MKFWDSSALFTFIADQPGSEAVKPVLTSDASLAIWWGTRVEMVSGACRLRRENSIDDSVLSELLIEIGKTCSEADEIEPSELVRNSAIRLLRTHGLRAADSLQLAAALEWAGQNPTGASFVCLDDRLRDAALREGFSVLPDESEWTR